MRKRYMLIGLVVLVLALAFIAQACDDTTTTTTAAPSTTTAPSTQTTTAPGTETTVAPSTETTVVEGPATGEPIKIGLLQDVTGAGAAPAESIGKGVDVQVEYVNAHGGINGRPLQIITLDTKSETPTAVNNIKKLINDDKVSLVLGPFSDYEIPACAAIAEQSQVPMIDSGAASFAQLDAKPQYQWAFGIVQSARTQSQAYLPLIKDNGWKKLLGVQDALTTSQEILLTLKENEAANGFSLTILPDVVQFGMTDFQPILNKVMEAYKAEKPDAVILNVNLTAVSAMYKGLRALGVTVPIISYGSAAHPAIFALGPDAVEGMLIMDTGGMLDPAALPDDWPLKAVQLDFAQRYQAKYNQAPDLFSAFGGDYVIIAVAAMKEAGGDDKAKVQQALLNLNGLVTLQGIVHYSPELTAEGIQGAMVMWQVKSGKFEFVKAFQ